MQAYRLDGVLARHTAAPVKQMPAVQRPARELPLDDLQHAAIQCDDVVALCLHLGLGPRDRPGARVHVGHSGLSELLLPDARQVRELEEWLNVSWELPVDLPEDVRGHVLPGRALLGLEQIDKVEPGRIESHLR